MPKGDSTREAIFEIHRTLTEDALDSPDAAGRPQRPDEVRVRVMDEEDGQILHTPPAADELPARLTRLCEFANPGGSTEAFTHPIIRAILLHFQLAYDHPFDDGNGRTARALFYWSALRDGYWLVEFLSISRIIQQAPKQYGRAFLYTETDDNDLTYFIVHQLDVVLRALDQLLEYVERKARTTRAAERLARAIPSINHRQLALLGHALRHPGFRYTYQSHALSHNVVRQTARTDLLALLHLGLVDRGTAGRQAVFIAPEDLASRIESHSSDA